MEPLIREAKYSDCDAVGALNKRNGLKVSWSPDQWKHIWQENPVLQQNPSIPIGWVLEYEENIVGYLGNVPLYYHFQGKRILAVAARGFAVDINFRSHSLRLAAAFFSQNNIELILNTSANDYAGKVFKLCKAKKIPYADYDKAFFFITDFRGFLISTLRKLGSGSMLASIGGSVLAPVIKLESMLRRRRPLRQKNTYEINILEPNSVSEEFDEFWQRTLSMRSNCLLSERSSEILRWHFGNSTACTRQAKIICAWQNKKLVGYLVLTREDSERFGLKRSHIADIIVENDEPTLIDALMFAAYEQACMNGSYMLEIIGFPTQIRDRLICGNAFKRQLSSWQYWYKAVTQDMQDSLISQDVWYGSSYDGDASL